MFNHPRVVALRKQKWVLPICAAGLLLLSGILAWPRPAAQLPAQQNAQQGSLGVGASGMNSSWGSVLWAVMALAIVLGLLYGSLWWLRTLSQPGRIRTAAGGEILYLQRSIRLGKDQTLHLVHFGIESLLIGASPAGLSVLARMPAATESQAEVPPAPFSHLLEKQLEDSEQ